MKLLLTDSGIRNASIQDALVGLLGKPIAEFSALCLPTRGMGAPEPIRVGRGGSSAAGLPASMTELGWKAVGVLELTALPSIDKSSPGLLGPGSRRPAGQRR